MADSHFQRVKELFAAVAAMPAGERASFLEVACAGDTKLRAEVQSLLNAQAPIEESDGGEPISEAPGMRIGPYKLLERIGEGTFGVVFMAEQEEPVRRRVALKVLKLGMDTKQVVARFEQERQALALMDHPNIAKVLDAGATSSGRPFFVMELVRGDPITEYCDREKLPTRDRLAIFVDVCRAVQHAHHKGVIHRDLKPSNVLVTLVDGRPVAKVIDFGVAKALHGPLTARTLFTEFRQMIGTPLYMSPEQAEMSGVDIDTRSDLYSLGVMLYELLTGTTPITREQMIAAGLAELHRTIREVEPPKPSTRLATLGAQGTDIAARRGTEVRRLGLLLRGDLDWIVMKCLEKDRTRRYETPISLVEDLLRHLSGEAVHAAPPSAMYQIQKFVRRKKGPVGASAAVVLTGLVGVGAFALKAEDAKNEALSREKAESARAEAERKRAEIESARAAEALAAAAEQRRLKEAADTHAMIANDARRLADIDAYVANLAAAQSALGLNDIASARRRLAACLVPKNWEWRFLNAETDNSLLTLVGHRSRVLSASFSPDRYRVLTTSGDGTARIWDLATGKHLAVLSVQGSRVLSAIFSPDGKRILTATSDKAARIWDSVTGSERRVLRGHEGRITSATFSPDSMRIATASSDKTGRIWDSETGNQIAALVGHKSDLVSVAFSSDGRQIVSASTDGTSRVWHGMTGSPVAVLGGSDRSITSATFSPDGLRIATVSADNLGRIWDAMSGSVLAVLRGHRGEIHSLEFSPDGTKLLTASDDGSARIWDGLSGRRLAVLEGGRSGLRSAAFDPTGTRVATACSDGTARIWDWRFVTELAVLRGHERAVNVASFSRDGGLILTVSNDGSARIWDGFMGTESNILIGHKAAVRSAAFSSDGKWIVTASDDGTARIWDGVGGRELGVLRGHSGAVRFAAFCPGSTRVITVSEDKTGRIWDAPLCKLLATLVGHEDALWFAAFSPDGTRIVTASDDKTARLWDGATGETIAVLFEGTYSLESVAFSADGTRVMTATSDNTARIWDGKTGKELAVLRGYEKDIQQAAFSPTGKRIFSTTWAGGARILEGVRTEKLSAAHSADVRETRSATFNPNGTRIVEFPGDETARIWDGSTGKELVVLRGHRSDVHSAAFSPDGAQVITTSSDNTARIWHSVPYRERFPLVRAIREEVSKAQQGVAQIRSEGTSFEDIRRRMVGESTRESLGLNDVWIRLLAIVDEEQREREARLQEAAMAQQSALVALWKPDSSRAAIEVALGQAQRAVELVPEAADNIRAVGMALFRLGDLDAAISELLKAEGLHRAANDERPTDWAFLAMTYAKLGRKEDAVAALSRTRELVGLDRFSENMDVAKLLAEAESVVAAAFPTQQK
ncbi:MAG: protein kinase [Planctomycetes bacterium]|nr:protein kinase [Planctomycetota bacterium]